jgi:hypothetical protein
VPGDRAGDQGTGLAARLPGGDEGEVVAAFHVHGHRLARAFEPVVGVEEEAVVEGAKEQDLDVLAPVRVGA